jgi:hypothetical protein
MKNSVLLFGASAALGALMFFWFPQVDSTVAQTQLRQSIEVKYEEYRRAIRDRHQIDIKDFKEKLKGGMADGKQVIDYDLKQLIDGIRWEGEHSTDKFLALELAMDHLQGIPDYYTRLSRMEWECRAEKVLDM